MRGYDQRFAGARHELIRWNGHFACFGFGVTLVAFRVGEELLLGMNKQSELISLGLVLLDFGA